MLKSLFCWLVVFLPYLGFTQFGGNAIDSLSHIIESTANPAEKARNLVLLSDEYQNTNLDTMPVLCLQALAIINESPLDDHNIEKLELRFAEAEALNNLGFYHLMKGDLDKSASYLKDAQEVALQSNHYECLTSVGINLSIVLGEQGDYQQAIKILERTEDFTKLKGLESKRGTVVNNIGWIYQVLREFDSALKYYKEAYAIQKSLGNRQSMSVNLSNIGVAFSGLEEHDSALYYFEEAYAIRLEENMPRGIANSLSNLGTEHMKMGDSVAARSYFIECLDICRKNDFKRQWTNSLNALGKLAIHQGDMATAQECVNEFDSIIPYYSTPVSQMGYYQIKYRLMEQQANWKEAYSSYKQYQSIRDSSQLKSMKYELMGREISIENEAEKDLIMERHDNELVLKEQEEKRQRQNLYSIIVVLGAVLFLLIFLFKNVRQRQKITALDLELSTLKNEKLEVEVGQQNKELTSYTLRVAQNNQFIENVDQLISSLDSSTNEEIEEQLHRFKSEINLTKRRDKDWVEFQRQFEGIHTSFIANLTQKHPKLSTNEIRLCTLMKLNLPSKDISSVLGISANTLKSSRYRIHKKLELEEGEKLADFILRFN